MMLSRRQEYLRQRHLRRYFQFILLRSNNKWCCSEVLQHMNILLFYLR